MRGELLDRILATRRELHVEGSSGGTLVLSPEGLDALLQDRDFSHLVRSWRSGEPREVFGMRIAVSRHLPPGVDFLLLGTSETMWPEPLPPFDQRLRESFRSLFDPTPVPAQTFEEWLEKTTEILAEAERLRR